MIGIKIFAVVGVDETGLTLALRQQDENPGWQIFIQMEQPAEDIRDSLIYLAEQLTTEYNKQSDAIQTAIEKLQKERRGL